MPGDAYSDHDLLVRIDTKLELYVEQQKEMKAEMKSELVEVWKAIDNLRDSQTSSKGFFDGARWLIGLATAVPASAAAYLFGSNR